MSTGSLPKVLVDADVVSHFLVGERMSLLNTVFPGRLAMVSQVEQELRVVRRFNNTIDNFIRFCQVEQLELPDDDALTLEYFTLQRTFGKGESACMALARHCGNYIASSNLRDIKTYCEKYHITYYTTMDVLCLAVEQGHMTEPECDMFIHRVKSHKGKLPCNTYQEYTSLKA